MRAARLGALGTAIGFTNARCDLARKMRSSPYGSNSTNALGPLRASERLLPIGTTILPRTAVPSVSSTSTAAALGSLPTLLRSNILWLPLAACRFGTSTPARHALSKKCARARSRRALRESARVLKVAEGGDLRATESPHMFDAKSILDALVRGGGQQRRGQDDLGGLSDLLKQLAGADQGSPAPS